MAANALSFTLVGENLTLPLTIFADTQQMDNGSNNANLSLQWDAFSLRSLCLEVECEKLSLLFSTSHF